MYTAEVRLVHKYQRKNNGSNVLASCLQYFDRNVAKIYIKYNGYKNTEYFENTTPILAHMRRDVAKIRQSLSSLLFVGHVASSKLRTVKRIFIKFDLGKFCQNLWLHFNLNLRSDSGNKHCMKSHIHLESELAKYKSEPKIFRIINIEKI
jgi:hypothetical protein